MNLDRLYEELAAARERAEVLERHGAPGPAEAVRAVVGDFEAALSQWQLESLTLDEAAEEVGKTRSALEKALADGRLPNAGRKGGPRILRKDLLGITSRRKRSSGSNGAASADPITELIR